MSQGPVRSYWPKKWQKSAIDYWHIKSTTADEQGFMNDGIALAEIANWVMIAYIANYTRVNCGVYQ